MRMRMAKSKRGDAVGNSNNNNHTAIFALAYESYCRASAPRRTREWLRLRLRLRLVIGSTSYTSRRRREIGGIGWSKVVAL